jgi:hypothetical protein
MSQNPRMFGVFTDDDRVRLTPAGLEAIEAINAEADATAASEAVGAFVAARFLAGGRAAVLPGLPMIDFAEALAELAANAVAFGKDVAGRIPEWLAELVRRDVLVLHSAITAQLWDRGQGIAVDPIDGQIQRAYGTVAAVVAELPSGAASTEALLDTIGRLSDGWRAMYNAGRGN